MYSNFCHVLKKELYMQEYVEDNPITFNDIPRVMSDILKKCDLLEQSIEILHEEIRQSNQKSPSEHIPMDVKEACEFLKIKKSTMYCYIQNGQIPVNKKGEKYTFFKDNLIKWVESGCKTEKTISTAEINQILSKRPSRRK